VNEKPLAIGSALAAFVASLCCLGPLLLGGFGVGAALVSAFAPLRAYFLILSAVLLATGFYFVYRRPRVAEVCHAEACTPNSSARQVAKPTLWLATIGVLALALFPYYGGELVRLPTGAAPASNANFRTIDLQISGMTCEACAVVVRSKLLETPGVITADVRFPAGQAHVSYDGSKTDVSRIISAIEAAGYTATLVGTPKE